MATSWRMTSAMRRSRTVPAAVSMAFFAASANESGLVPIISVTRYTLPATATPSRWERGASLFGSGRLCYGAVGGSRVIAAEHRRARDEQARARLGDTGHGVGVDAAVDLDRGLGQQPLELAHLALGSLDVELAAPARVDGHAQHE